MKRIMMAGLLAGSCILSAPVQAAGTYEAAVAARYIDLDFRGSRSQVQEYDGKLYRGAHGDVSVSNQGTEGLFDLSIKDIGSTEENAALNVDYKDTWKISALYNTMHHRLNERGAGLISNNVYVPNPQIVSTLVYDENLVIRRSETEFNVARYVAGNSARWVALRYWSAEKAGSQAFHAGTYQLGRANVDNLTQDIRLGFGTDLGENAAMALDLLHNDFKDSAYVPRYPTALGFILKPAYGHQTVNGGEARFRYNPNQKLAMTAVFTGRQRENQSNQFKDNIVVGALNAAYKAGQNLSLTARLHLHANQVDENTGFKYLAETNAVNGHQLDKTALKGELGATWRPVHKVAVKGAYKVEVTNRRNAPTEQYSTASQGFFDGTVLPVGSWNNSMPVSETRHTAAVGTKVELPFGIEAEAAFKKLMANRAAFVGLPTSQDDASASLTVPLPKEVQFTLLGGYVKERNKNDVQSRNYSAKRNTYRAALDWAASNKMFFGADASYENLKYIFDGRFGSTAGNVAFYEAGMTNTQRNTVLGAHTRVICPKGFVVTARGSYTWSKVQTPLHYVNVPLAYTIDDYSPSDVRIARGSLAVEYTPEKFKDLTARASYSIDDWGDRTDNVNSGRASVAQLGASMKF